MRRSQGVLSCGALALLMLMSQPVRGDELALHANELLAVQLTDAITTDQIVRNGGFERDPIAKPFTHNLAMGIGAAVVLNMASRMLFRHSPKVMHWLAVADGVAVINNVGWLRKR